MFHSRCTEIATILREQISSLKRELADERSLREVDRKEAKEREDKLLERLSQAQRPTPVPIMVAPRERHPLEELKLNELPPEFFDADNALYVGNDIVSDSWVPPHHKTPNGRAPRTAAGQALKEKLEARQAAEAKEGEKA